MNKRNEKIRVLLLNPVPSLIKYGMRWGFDKIGCFTYLFMDDDRIYDKTKEYQLKRIEEVIIEKKINLLFCEGYSNMPVVEISELCKRYNVQFHWWTIEDPVTPHIGEYVSQYCDFIWTTTVEFIPKYKKLGRDSDVLLFGCNPDFHIPAPFESGFEHDISLVGTNYSNRYDKTKEFIMPLIENNFDIKIYGLWWMESQREVNLCKYPHVYWKFPPYDSLPYEWLSSVINSSKIMIGANCQTDMSITQTSCRPYETLACSGYSVYISYYSKAQEILFGESGKYIYQAKTGQEMIDMVKEVLSMTNEQRKEMADRAREFIYINHNYALRAKQVVDCFYKIGGI